MTLNKLVRYCLILLLVIPVYLIARENLPETTGDLSWISLLPPLIAIALALITRQTIVSLFAGVWIGVSLLEKNPITGFTTTLDTYLVQSLADTGHASILLFSLGFGGIIGVISANGGMKGIIQAASKYARSGMSGQLSTAVMGVIIFFDDYANTLLVGNMMRPFTDKLKISREKLSYLVDSTAAPVASIAVISTWSVFQMSLLDGPFQEFGITGNPYITFLKSIPYSFYCIFTLVFVFTNILMRREYGPMHQAQMRARTEGKVLGDNANPMMDPHLMEGDEMTTRATHWSNALIPILTVITITLVGLYVTGKNALGEGGGYSLQDIISGSDSYAALMWASFTTGGVAILISILKKILTLHKAMEAWLNGVRSMVLACVILVLAWTLGNVCGALNTADYLVHLTAGNISPPMLPAITFFTAALISFSTGSSWATMSIMVPIIAPMTIKIMAMDPNLVVQTPIFISTFAAILSGATFGDHCSPISDTTIMSSMASGADHIDHVRTQLPYALTTGIIAFFSGYLLIGLGASYMVAVLTSLALIFVILRFVGKPLPRTVF
ncbi:MAG: Na+/H+ antiporter NhaC family protein [Fidelibacterota bacterium]